MSTRPRPWPSAVLSALLVLSCGLVVAPVAAEVQEAPDAGAVQPCWIRVLPEPAGLVRTTVAAGDPSGRMLAGSGIDAEGTAHVVRWENRVPRLLDGPSGSFEVTSVSRSGVVGGYLNVVPNIGFVITAAGHYREVTAPGGGVYVEGVADDGTVAGSAIFDDRPRPALWKLGAYDSPTILAVPGGHSATVAGMAADGSLAVSTAMVDSQPLRVYAWTADGDRMRLHGTPGGTELSVTAIADRYAAGFEWDPDAGVSRILRWRLPSGRVTAIESPGPHRSMSVDAVNRHGVIGGQVLDGPPALIVGEDLIELPTLAAGFPAGVRSVGSDGQAAGWARDDDQSIHAVRWHCG